LERDVPVLYGAVGSEIERVKEDRKGNLIFAADGSGTCRYDGKSFVTFTPWADRREEIRQKL